jgi:hypothetical protein
MLENRGKAQRRKAKYRKDVCNGLAGIRAERIAPQVERVERLVHL